MKGRITSNFSTLCSSVWLCFALSGLFIVQPAAAESIDLPKETNAIPQRGPILGEYSASALKPAAEAFTSARYQEAHAKLKKAKPQLRNGELDDYYLIKGLTLLEEKQYGEAHKALARSLNVRAKNSDTLHGLGLVYYHLDKPEQSTRAFEEALWFNSYRYFQKQESWAALVIAYRGANNPEKEKLALNNAKPSKAK